MVIITVICGGDGRESKGNRLTEEEKERGRGGEGKREKKNCMRCFWGERRKIILNLVKSKVDKIRETTCFTKLFVLLISQGEKKSVNRPIFHVYR